MIRRPPRSTLFPTRRSSDLLPQPRGDPGGGGQRPRPAHEDDGVPREPRRLRGQDRKSTRLNSSHVEISYAVFCLKKKKKKIKKKNIDKTADDKNTRSRSTQC